jgi:UDP-glucuronate 4-epimerase
MLCVVTGVAGFVGSSVADRLLAEGHTVRGIDCFVEYYPKELKLRNLARARDNGNFSFVEENLLHTDLAPLLDGAQWVFHQAAQAGVRASWGRHFSGYTENNVLATQRLLEAVKGSSSILKVVYASSSSVYGNAERYPTHESDLPKPVSPYGVTKLAAEHLMCLYASEFGVPTTSLRYFTVFGPRQRPDMSFNKFIRAALRGEEIPLYGDGEQSRDFTFIDDIVQANLLAAAKGAPGGVYNVGGGAVVTMNQVIAILESIIGPVKVKHGERQAGDARHTGADTGKARRELGYDPQVSVMEGLKRETQWLQELV